MSDCASWGNYPPVTHQRVSRPLTATDVIAALGQQRPLLPRGLGRSQGDSCLNAGGGLIDLRRLNHFLAFDQTGGIVRCEAGVTLADILALVVPRGWFLPVTPGTKYVTVGGAIANDVHGKNHHRAGTFGHHVRRFGLLRSTGEQLICSPKEQADLFRATIGGLGLTGVVTWAEIQLRPITSQFINENVLHLSSLDDFFAAAAHADTQHEYTVAWIDCLAHGRRLGRGLLLLGNHAQGGGEAVGAVNSKHLRPRLTVPVNAPSWLINQASIKVFNWLWYHKEHWQRAKRIAHFNSFFYPLDGVGQWNKLYGRRGFFQYQCVVPRAGGAEAIRELLFRIAHSQLASFLSTMKYFGDKQPAGLLSFPRPGITLAVDFANKGESTLELFKQLDEVVRQSSGAVYPAKDSRMPPHVFQASFPRWREFAQYIDPALSSSFWRRVTL